MLAVFLLSAHARTNTRTNTRTHRTTANKYDVLTGGRQGRAGENPAHARRPLRERGVRAPAHQPRGGALQEGQGGQDDRFRPGYRRRALTHRGDRQRRP